MMPADFQVAAHAVAPRGRFVVLEGIDGCGKSTQIEALRRWLPTSGLLATGAELLVTREPGGTALGAALRQLLLHPPGEAAPEPMAELLLYAADRAQHVEQCIRPALAAGVLLPGFGVLLTPPLAAMLMALSSITVVANALLLQDGRDDAS